MRQHFVIIVSTEDESVTLEVVEHHAKQLVYQMTLNPDWPIRLDEVSEGDNLDPADEPDIHRRIDR